MITINLTICETRHELTIEEAAELMNEIRKLLGDRFDPVVARPPAPKTIELPRPIRGERTWPIQGPTITSFSEGEQ